MTMKPHITETIHGTFLLSYGEEILGEHPSLRAAISKARGEFNYTPYSGNKWAVHK